MSFFIFELQRIYIHFQKQNKEHFNVSDFKLNNTEKTTFAVFWSIFLLRGTQSTVCCKNWSSHLLSALLVQSLNFAARLCATGNTVSNKNVFLEHSTFHTTKLSNRNIYFHVIQKVLHVWQEIRFPDWQTNKVGELGTGRIKSTTHDLSIKAMMFRKHVVSLRSGYTYCPNTKQNSSYTRRDDGRRINFWSSVILHKELGRWTKFK